jgi:hypothetical protein
VSISLVVTVHEVATDGLPDMQDLTGRVALISDGCIVSGWPLIRGPEETRWEADTDLGCNDLLFAGVTHWIEFPVPIWEVAGER